MKTQPITQLVIAGGGTAGWMAASALAQHFQHTPLRITLVESSAIGTVGVGEATIPTIRRFYRQLGLTDGEVMQATQATAKLGIAFENWKTPGHRFIHPFGRFGQDRNGTAFHHFWARLHKRGLAKPLGHYSLPVALAEAGKFTPPAAQPGNALGLFDWALHLDASAFAALLKRKAQALGVTAIDARITGVEQQPETGFIRALHLDSGARLEGELFIDCTGFDSLLLGKTLQVGYESWQAQLLCDRAAVVQTERSGPPPSCTLASAQGAGWQWRIPLQERQGNGYVFASSHLSDDQACDQLLKNAGATALHSPRILSFTPGRRVNCWEKNCIALGLSAGFLEPLESTSIALIETGIEKIKQLFPETDCAPVLIDEFNHMTRLEYERVRDFIILHYTLNQREGEPFWDACRSIAPPDTLTRKMALFKARGHLLKYRWEIFQNPSWVALYAGFDFLPNAVDPAANGPDEQQLVQWLTAMEKGLQHAVADAPEHQAFLQYLHEAAPA